MKTKPIKYLLTFSYLLSAICLLTSALCLPAFAQGTAFTYQGRLNDGVNPANGSYDLTFALYDAASGPAQAGGTLTNAATAVSNGLFTVTLDFGNQFPGADRWLEIALRTNGVGAFGLLNPRQKLTPTPYAIYSGGVSASGISGIIPASSLSGSYSNAVNLTNVDNTLAGNGTGVTNVNAVTLGGLSATNFWKLGGNAGTTPGTDFLGTTDNLPLEFKVNGTRALRLEPTGSNSVNVIGGWLGNAVAPGVVGATIGGGGAGDYFGFASTNRVEANFGTISGGRENTIQTNAIGSIIGGGYLNTIQIGAGYATIGGGYLNTIQTIAFYSTISGGSRNAIQPDAFYSTVGGGRLNTIQTNADYATIGGGYFNTIQTNADYAAIGGGYFNTIQTDATYATIGGGYFNTIQTNAIRSFIGGGSGNTIQPNATYATIGGGIQNTIQTGASFATVGGGGQNTIQPNASYATIPGGNLNSAASYAFASGRRAKANHQGSFVWGDSQDADFASTGANQFCIRANGGVELSGDTKISFGSTLGTKLNLYSTSFGIGIQNATLYSRVGAGGYFAWYAGGAHADSPFDNGGGTTLMTLTTGGLLVNGAFVSASDRNLKQDFSEVNSRSVLEKVVQLPIQTWFYKNDPGTKHLGPMAQDFYAAFGVGPDDKHIATVDESGVALAAIQGLNQKVEETRAENAELKRELSEIKQLLLKLSDKKD